MLPLHTTLLLLSAKMRVLFVVHMFGWRKRAVVVGSSELPALSSSQQESAASTERQRA